MRLAGLAALLVVAPLYAADPAGLDVTIEVLGREDRVDERIVNRIAVPGVQVERAPGTPLGAVGGVVEGVGETVNGVGGVVGNVVDGVVAPLLPLLRYDEWVEQRREAGRERDRDAP